MEEPNQATVKALEKMTELLQKYIEIRLNTLYDLTYLKNSEFERTDAIQTKNLMEKKIQFLCHLECITILIENNKVFRNYDRKKFPELNKKFKHCKSYQEERDKIIQKFQEQAMNLCKEATIRKLAAINESLDRILTKHRMDPDIDSKFEKLWLECTKSQAKLIHAAKIKTERILRS
jgi:hypothetical protein